MFLFIVFCCALPLLWLVWQLLNYPQALSQISFTGYRGRLLLRTVGYNACVALLAVLMGLPAAFVIGRGKSWLAKVVMFLVPLPLVLPSITYAYGWSQQLRLLNSLPFPSGRADVLVCRQVVPYSARLRRAPRRAGLGVEIEDDGSAAQRRERDARAVLVGKGEVGGLLAGLDHRMLLSFAKGAPALRLG